MSWEGGPQCVAVAWEARRFPNKSPFPKHPVGQFGSDALACPPSGCPPHPACSGGPGSQPWCCASTTLLQTKHRWYPRLQVRDTALRGVLWDRKLHPSGTQHTNITVDTTPWGASCPLNPCISPPCNFPH